MVSPANFSAFVVRKDEDGKVRAAIEELTVDDLPAGNVLIEVAYSSLNYKDALATQAHPGVVTSLPHVPGIDCAGTVAQSTSDQYQVGQEVIITGYGLGSEAWGGLSQFVRVPQDWIVPLPAGLTLRDCMAYGTAGFTAAQCVAAITGRGIEPDAGQVVVTGATGGVGSISVAILAKLGYEVAAVTGKPDQHDLLRELGASQFLDRSEVVDDSKRPMLKARWVAAVDTVGGKTLSTVIRSLKHRGCVAACGLVGGDQLNLTVYPFILRGATLVGIDSAKSPRGPRLEIWQKLAGAWRVEQLEKLAENISLEQLPEKIEAILAGEIAGRTIVHLQK